MNTGSTAPATAVILVAAGSGQRLGYGMPKARVPLGGEPILMHALRGIVASGVAGQVCVALPAGDAALRQMCDEFRTELVDGGPLLTPDATIPRRACIRIGSLPRGTAALGMP